MKECADCGLTNPDEAVTCPACGASAWKPPTEASNGLAGDGSLVCPVCAAPNEPASRTCSACRAPLSEGAGVLGSFGLGGIPAATRRTRRHRWLAIGVWLSSAASTGLLILELASSLGRPRTHLEEPGRNLILLLFLAISAFITVAGIHGKVWKREDS